MIRVPSGNLGHAVRNRRTLSVIILFLQCFFMISPALSYRADISLARNSVQLPRGPAGVPGLVLNGKKPFSQYALSRRKKLKQGHRDDGGVSPKIEGALHEVSSEKCTSMGLEKCGDLCVEQCCNTESTLACPANSYCMANEEYEFCCEKGHTCNEPIDCLNMNDIRCVNSPGELIDDGGKEKACCYTGFELCTTTWDGFPACMPAGVVEAPPKPPKHTHTGAFDSDTIKPTPTPSGIYSKPTPTITALPDILDSSYRHEAREVQKAEDNTSLGVATDTIQNEKHSNNTPSAGMGSIIGGVVGGVLGLTIVSLCAFLTRRHYQKSLEKEEQEVDGESNEVDGKALSISVTEMPESPSLNSWLDLGVEDTERKLSSPRRTSTWSNPTLNGTPSIGRSQRSSRMGKTQVDEWYRSRGRERDLERSQSWRSRSYSTDTGGDSVFTRPPHSSMTTNYTTPSASPPPMQEKVWSWRQYQEDDDEDAEPPTFANRQISPRLPPVYRDPYSSILSTASRSLKQSSPILPSRNW